MEDRVSRRSYAGCLFQLNLVAAPAVAALVIFSSLVSAPMLAVFTLPVFFMAFPRPLKFWPGAVGSTEDSEAKGSSEEAAYYAQMLPSLVSSLHRANR